MLNIAFNIKLNLQKRQGIQMKRFLVHFLELLEYHGFRFREEQK